MVTAKLVYEARELVVNFIDQPRYDAFTGLLEKYREPGDLRMIGAELVAGHSSFSTVGLLAVLPVAPISDIELAAMMAADPGPEPVAALDTRAPLPDPDVLFSVPAGAKKIAVATYGDPSYDLHDNYNDEQDDDIDDDDDERRARIAALAKQLTGEQYIILDTETTGTNASTDEIVQIAIIGPGSKTLYKSYVKPTRPITNSHIHGITDEMVADAPSFSEVYEKIAPILLNDDEQAVAVYNFNFDVPLLDSLCKRNGFTAFSHQWSSRSPAAVGQYCIMELFAEWYGEWNNWHGNYKWQKLSTAVSYFELAWPGQAHDALADALAAEKVLHAMARWEPPKRAPKLDKPPF